MNRRHFLLSTAASGLGLIVPGVAERVFTAVAKTKAPLIEPAARASQLLFAVRLGPCYQLNLDTPEHRFPETYRTTWRAYLLESYDGDLEQGMDEWEIRPEQLDRVEEFETDVERWAATESPNARAHRLLAGLNIGPMLRDSSGSLGHIEFVDGACPGNDYIGAHVHDDVSLSLLQVRLNDLRAGIGIRLA
jgi:hypothetical protein